MHKTTMQDDAYAQELVGRQYGMTTLTELVQVRHGWGPDVYQAIHAEHGLVMALVGWELSTNEHADRFAAAQLVRHPRLRHAYAFMRLDQRHEGVLRRRSTLVVEAISGHVLGPDTPMPVARRIAMVWDLVHAVRAVHDAGLVHANVCPSNVWLDDVGRAVLCALSIRGYGGPVREAGFYPPECPVAGRKAPPTRAMDVFGLGVLLGGHPGLPETDADAHRVTDLVASMTHPDPDHRPTTGEVAADLGRVAGEMGVAIEVDR